MRYFLPLLCATCSLLAQEPTPIALEDLKRADAVAFDKEILPVLAAKCQVCHSGQLIEGKLDLSTHASMLKGGKNGPVVVAGKADDSLLFKTSAHRVKPIMPPKSENNPLTSREASLLKLWIDQGAKAPAVDAKAVRNVVLALPPALVKPVRALAFSPDRATLAVARGNHILLFDAKTAEPKGELVDAEVKTPKGESAGVAHIALVESLAYAPDGKTLASGSYRGVTLWDTEKAAPRRRIAGFADRVVALAWSPDESRFAAGGGAPTEDGEVRVFEASGKPVLEIKAAHSDAVFGVAFSPNGKLLASAGADKFVRVFEVPSGKPVKSFEGHTQHVLDVGWTGDGARVVSAGAEGGLKVWDYEKGEKLRDINAGTVQLTRLAMIPKTANFLAAAADGSAKLWGADSGNAAKTYDGGKDFLYAVATTDDGKSVALGGEEGVVRLYGVDGKLVKAIGLPEVKK